MSNQATKPKTTPQPKAALPTENGTPLLPPYGVLAVLYGFFELDRTGIAPELEPSYRDPETRTLFYARANFTNRTIELSITSEAGEKPVHDKRIYTYEQVKEWRIANP
jgi:hypothetical protein